MNRRSPWRAVDVVDLVEIVIAVATLVFLAFAIVSMAHQRRRCTEDGGRMERRDCALVGCGDPATSTCAPTVDEACDRVCAGASAEAAP